MLKKWIGALLAAVLLVVGMAGCGVEQDKKYAVLTDNFGEEEYAIGFRKEDVAFRNEVQNALHEMQEDGTLNTIMQKWFQQDFKKTIDKVEETATDGSWDYIKSQGKIVMGLDDAVPPMGFRDENTNEIIGVDIDLAKEVAKRLDVELELMPIDWNTKEAALNTKKIDIIWNGLTVTPERQEMMLFSASYLDNTQAIAVIEGSDIKSKEDLAGKKIGVQAGSSALESMQKDAVFASIGEGNIQEYETMLNALMDLKIGRIDAVVADETVVRYNISKQEENQKAE
ncbi:MAG: transporter substrate-binding domain-containing protein [Clostridia bacterium]|nr:transporter substrate-binding domain-containing protein [Clostridia bacterium]